jgi:2-keto-4-pentenoate hydratase/2-oxohepta-3-ene-1,7-dioic acid hydratase in catechol pathway
MIKNLHYEAELGIVIKKRAYRISEKESKEYIEGYTCANDVTARDLQNLDGQWTRAKSFNTFCPLGPRIAKDIDPNKLDIKLLLNGQVKQHSNTEQMIFKPAYLVSFISQIMTLLPGDVILTGTPPGVGPMQKGDQVIVEIEGIGRLTNKIV